MSLISFSVCSMSCEQITSDGQWIKGTDEEKIETIEKQFRGFDMAMVETGYRYQELYWAGQDENWEYAKYQLEKIRKTIDNGLERRPKRAASAQAFLNVTLPEMQRAIDSKDLPTFNQDFETLTLNCNSCHEKEKVPHFVVKTPRERQSPIRQ